VNRINQLETGEQFAAALELIRESVRKYPEEATLIQLENRVSQAWDEHQRQEAVRRVVSEATLLIFNGRLDEADEMLKEGTLKYPGQADLEKLVARNRKPPY
jgi:hypothetical protein